MPRPSYEISLHSSLYASPNGYAIALFAKSLKYPAQNYQYRLIDLATSDLLLPNRMVQEVFEGWYRNYNDPDMRRLGVCPINILYCNTLQYKQDIRQQFNRAKQQGYQGESKPLVGEWKYYQVRSWQHVESLSGDVLHGALLKLSAAVNNGQLLIADPSLSQKLREEMSGDYDWDIGVKSMPVTLAAFVQAFSQMPLKVKRSAAQTYLRRGVF
ncbi:MAG: hypothetical protein ACFB2W_00555 [Leptolyngbyaceae cyanobacterium]